MKKSPIISIVLVITAGAVLFIWLKEKNRFGYFETDSIHDPIGIEFIGVRPDASDRVYDGNGKPLKDARYPSRSRSYWNSDSMQREFILKFPKTEDPITFKRFVHISAAGNHGLSSSQNTLPYPYGEDSLLLSCLSFPKTYKKSFLFFTRDMPVRTVNLEIPYYYGPRRKCQYSFTGPFEPGKTIASDQSTDSIITISPTSSSSIHYVASEFEFVTPHAFSMDNDDVLVYDKDGNRHLIQSGGGRRGSNGAKMHYRIENLYWDDVAAITFGEEPYVARFNNINVHFPQLPQIDHLPYLDEVTERLGLTGMPIDKVYQHQIGIDDPKEVFKVIDVAEKEYASRIVRELIFSRKKYDIDKLDEPTRQRIKEAAARLTASPTFSEKQAGVCLGLINKEKEYVDQAIDILQRHNELLQKPSPYYFKPEAFHLVAHTLAFCGPDWTQEQTEKLKKIIYESNHYSVFRPLITGFMYRKHPYTTEAVKELTLCDKPWIWWEAVNAHRHLDPDLYRDVAEIPEPLRWRYVLREYWRSSEDYAKEAAAMAALRLTTNLLEKNPGAFSSMRERMIYHLDRKTCTVVLADFLASANVKYTPKEFVDNSRLFDSLRHNTVYIANCLNNWYDQDFGGLGQKPILDVYYEVIPQNAQKLFSLINSILQWRKENPDATPAPLSFSARVVDSEQQPIPGAEIEITERYIINHGTVKKGNTFTLTTDPNGWFHFDQINPDYEYTLNIAANGFIDRTGLDVRKSTMNGGYFMQDGNEIELSPAGKS